MKLLLYCTKAKPYLYGMYSGFESRYGYHLTNDKNVFKEHSILNGKIVAECDYEVEEILYLPNPSEFDRANFLPKEWCYDYIGRYGTSNKSLLKKSCLTTEQLSDYLNTKSNDKKTFGKDTFGYAIHIKNLHIFDEPKELSDYESFAGYKKYYQINDFVKLEKTPQNMCKILKPYIRFNRDFKVYEDFDILISIRPEWLCKILNGEKTIEVRKKVLKEML